MNARIQTTKRRNPSNMLPNEQWLEYRDDEIVRTDTIPDVTTGVIPPLIFASWHTSELPKKMAENFQTIVDMHPNYTCKLYDEHLSREFLQKFFREEVLWAYDMLVPKAYKSDLWRYCILYIYGGIYIDVKFQLVDGFTFNTVTYEVYVKDRPEHFANGNGIQNTFMAVFPRNAYLLKAIKGILYHCHIKYYGQNSICPTGPGLLSYIFPLTFLCNASYNFIGSDITNEQCEVIYHNGKIILKKYNGYRHEQASHGERYQNLYSQKRIYTDQPIPAIIHQTYSSIFNANFILGWKCHSYDIEERRSFIQKIYPPIVLWAYDTLIPIELKEDLFRYCVLYTYGGGYIDNTYEPVDGFSLDKLLEYKRDVFTYIESEPASVYHGVMICKPKNQHIRKAIWNIIDNVKNMSYGCCSNCPTGAHMFQRLFLKKEIERMPIEYTNVAGMGVIRIRTTGRIILQQREHLHNRSILDNTWLARDIYNTGNYPCPY